MPKLAMVGQALLCWMVRRTLLAVTSLKRSSRLWPMVVPLMTGFPVASVPGFEGGGFDALAQNQWPFRMGTSHSALSFMGGFMAVPGREIEPEHEAGIVTGLGDVFADAALATAPCAVFYRSVIIFRRKQTKTIMMFGHHYQIVDPAVRCQLHSLARIEIHARALSQVWGVTYRTRLLEARARAGRKQ